MIVRILTEGQYELDDGDKARLNELDVEAQAAVEADDEAAFRRSYQALVDEVRARGRKLDDDDLRGSDIMLPPPDVSLDEARGDFSEHGLIPD